MGTKPAADSLAVNIQRLRAGRAGTRLWQATIGLGVMVASCVAYAVGDLPPPLPVTPDAREASLGEVLVEFRDKYGLEVSLADERWENLPVTARPGEATFNQALRDLLRGYSYYLVRHDRRRSTLYFSGPNKRGSDNSEVQPAMNERRQAQSEAEWLDEENWVGIWNEGAAEVEYFRAADLDANELNVSEWVELRSIDGEIETVRREDVE